MPPGGYLGSLQMEHLQSLHRLAYRNGWDEVRYDILDELSVRALDRPGE